jgi:hypothetical protein
MESIGEYFLLEEMTQSLYLPKDKRWMKVVLALQGLKHPNPKDKLARV